MIAKWSANVVGVFSRFEVNEIDLDLRYTT